jgi:hypothetical protein
MSIADPQFMYIILVLPTLFGITLTGEGLYRCVHEEWSGLISVIFGGLFLLGVIAAYFLFSTFIIKQI